MNAVALRSAFKIYGLFLHRNFCHLKAILQWLMIQHGIFPYFRPCIPTTCRTGNPLIFKESSMHPLFYYKSTGDETNVICLDTLVSVTGIDIYFVATSFSSVRNLINSSSVNVNVQPVSINKSFRGSA